MYKLYVTVEGRNNIRIAVVMDYVFSDSRFGIINFNYFS